MADELDDRLKRIHEIYGNDLEAFFRDARAAGVERKTMNREIERGTGSAATMNVTVITCGGCGRAVTPAIPWEDKEPLVVAARVECPECAGKAKAQLAEVERERDKWRTRRDLVIVRAEKAEARLAVAESNAAALSARLVEASQYAETAEADAKLFEAAVAGLKARLANECGRANSAEARQCEKCEASIEEFSMLTFQIAECDRQKAELEARLAEAEKERDSLETYMRERGIEIPEAPDAERPEENEKTK